MVSNKQFNFNRFSISWLLNLIIWVTFSVHIAGFSQKKSDTFFKNNFSDQLSRHKHQIRAETLFAKLNQGL